MSEHPLLQKYSGPLLVVVHTLDGEEESFEPDFEDDTLFGYVGHACACIFINMTTQLVVRTRPEYWEIVRFSPEERILEVRQIGGEPLRIREDDPEQLENLFAS